LILQGKKLRKSVYVFSVDAEANLVVHANCVDLVLKAKGLDARAWANNAATVVGGKVPPFNQQRSSSCSLRSARLEARTTTHRGMGRTFPKWTKP
jgi:hypothetical protein